MALEKAVAQWDARIVVLEAENVELRRGSDTENSNLPPSAQGLDKVRRG